ncbi:hypothetical protein D9M72_411020 [compost metagenome]
MQSGGLAPGVHAGRGEAGREDGGELLLGVFQLPVALEELDEFFAQLREDFYVQGRVPQPWFRERAGGPVGGGMFLREAEPEQLLDDCCQAHPRQPREPRCELGIEQFVRPHAQFRQARKVLARCVQDPLDAFQGVVDDLQVTKGFRIDEPRSRAFAPDLHQEGPLPVAEARRAFRVHPGRTRPGGDRGGAAFQPRGSFND